MVVQVNAISCAGSIENLNILDKEAYKARTFDVGSSADVAMGAEFKYKRGELEFESLMRMLDNLVRHTHTLSQSVSQSVSHPFLSLSI